MFFFFLLPVLMLHAPRSPEFFFPPGSVETVTPCARESRLARFYPEAPTGSSTGKACYSVRQQIGRSIARGSRGSRTSIGGSVIYGSSDAGANRSAIGPVTTRLAPEVIGLERRFAVSIKFYFYLRNAIQNGERDQGQKNTFYDEDTLFIN